MGEHMTETTRTPRKPRIKRGTDLRMQVSEDVKERLKRIADMYGMPPSTLAAFAIGHWIAHQEAGLRVVDAMAEKVGGEMGEQIRQQFGLFDKSTGGGPKT